MPSEAAVLSREGQFSDAKCLGRGSHRGLNPNKVKFLQLESPGVTSPSVILGCWKEARRLEGLSTCLLRAAGPGRPWAPEARGGRHLGKGAGPEPS